MSEVGGFRVEGAFGYATATDARTAKKAYAKIAAKLPALDGFATFTTKDVTIAGEIAAGERELQERRWCLTLQAMREAAERANRGTADVVLAAWRDRHRVSAGGSIVRAPDEPPEGARRFGGAAWRTPSAKCMVAAPDGTWIAVGGESTEHFTSLAVRIRTTEASGGGVSTADVRVLDLDGRVVQVFSLDVQHVHALWVRPDGEALVAATSSGMFAMERASGRCWSLKRGDGSRYLAGSPSGAWVAGVVGKEVCFFDARTWKKIRLSKMPSQWFASMFACGERLVVGTGRAVVYDGAVGTVMAEREELAGELELLADGRVRAVESGVIVDLDSGAREDSAVTEKPTGERLVVEVAGGGRLRALENDCVLEGADGEARARIPVPAVSAAVAVGDRVYLGGGARVVPVDVVTGRAALDGHAGEVRAFAFSDDGAQVASLGWGGEIIVWDVATGSERSRLPIGYATDSYLVWLRDGFVYNWSDTLYLVRPDGARDAVKLPTSPKCMRASREGRWLVVGGYQQLMAIDLVRGELAAVAIPDWVEDVAFVDEDRVVIACHKELAVVDLAARKFGATSRFGATWLTGGGAGGGRVTAWGRGERVVMDGAGAIVERTPGAASVPGHFRGALCAQAMASGDEHVVSVRVHGAEAWTKTATASEVTALAFAPGGKQLVSGHDDGSIFVWEVGA